MAVLKMGNRGIDVRKLQILLNATLTPSPGLREDGDFGLKTHEAVLRFQKAKSLLQDGVVGQKTWMALGQKMSTVPKSPAVSTQVGAPWMQIAEAELGIHEDSLPGHNNQRILEYHKTTTLKATTDEVAWCSSFVNWVMTRAGYHGTNSALAKSWLDWGGTLRAPKVGAITVIRKKGATSDVATGSTTGFHVAFYVSSTPTHIRLLGGNQGDQVKYSSFPMSTYEVKGNRWPA